jgi:hypothetical protein
VTMKTIGKIGGLIIISLLAVFIVSTHAHGKVPGMCVPTHNLNKEMAKRYSEKLLFRGISTDGYYVMIYFDPMNKSWTAFGVHPAQPHKACPLSAGVEGEVIIDKGAKL